MKKIIKKIKIFPEGSVYLEISPIKSKTDYEKYEKEIEGYYKKWRLKNEKIQI